MSEMRKVVVTGMGTVNPIGLNTEEFWASLMAGKSGLGPITRFDVTDFPAKVAGEIKNFSPDEVIGRKKARRMALFSQYAVYAADEALKQAGVSNETVDSKRIGVYIGNGIGGQEVNDDSQRKLIEKGCAAVPPLTIPLMIANEAGGNISIFFGFHGPSHTIVTACASGTDAMGAALDAVRMGRVDVAVTGGTEAAISPFALAGFSQLTALSTHYNDTPEKASRPFDKNRDGFVLGEGAGVLIFEEKEHAVKRGAAILAEVAGYGSSTDAYHITAPEPSGQGAALAMKNALKDADMAPEAVGYYNAHGTSTPINDPTETESLKITFGQHAYNMLVSSTKSMTGHCIAGAGAIEAIASIMALTKGKVPPTINLEEPDEKCDLNYVPHKPQDAELEAVMSGSLGFGGHNGMIIFKKG